MKGSPHRLVGLFLRMQQSTEVSAAAMELPDVCLDLRLARRPLFEPPLLGRVQVLATNPVVTVEHQLQPHELFQLVVAQAVLQGSQ